MQWLEATDVFNLTTTKHQSYRRWWNKYRFEFLALPFTISRAPPIRILLVVALNLTCCRLSSDGKNNEHHNKKLSWQQIADSMRATNLHKHIKKAERVSRKKVSTMEELNSEMICSWFDWFSSSTFSTNIRLACIWNWWILWKYCKQTFLCVLFSPKKYNVLI